MATNRSKAIMKRLPVYLEYLKNMPDTASPYISATMLARALELGEVQVRKDLAAVCDGGRPKVGYLREKLANDLEHYLRYDNTDVAILVGAGKLGQALLDYSEFGAYGLKILAAFDVKPAAVQSEGGKPILPMDKIREFCETNKVGLAILTVPKDQAQSACDQLVEIGIKAIWNFAPVHLDVPDNIMVRNEDLAPSLAVLSMHLQTQMREKK